MTELINNNPHYESDRSGLKAVLAQHPELVQNGFERYSFHLPASRAAYMEMISAQREKFLEPGGVAQFSRAMNWLATASIRIRKTLNRKHSSYHWKHVAEAAEGDYISNGAFIAAAIDMSYKVISVGEYSLNAYINISIPLNWPPKRGADGNYYLPNGEFWQSCRFPQI